MKIVVIIFAIVILFALSEWLYIRFGGSPVAVPAIPRGVVKAGTQGRILSYVIMGDSTAVTQGAEYSEGYSYASLQYLAKKHRVISQNFAVSGARVRDVRTTQLAQALVAKPDVVLLAVGANDVTHLTRSAPFRTDLEAIIQSLQRQNPNVKIIATGVPAMGSVPRLPWPLKQLAGLRTRQLNDIYTEVGTRYSLTLAPIAQETGLTFIKHPEYFAADKFHPNAAGYDQWIPVINRAIDQAIKT